MGSLPLRCAQSAVSAAVQQPSPYPLPGPGAAPLSVAYCQSPAYVSPVTFMSPQGVSLPSVAGMDPDVLRAAVSSPISVVFSDVPPLSEAQIQPVQQAGPVLGYPQQLQAQLVAQLQQQQLLHALQVAQSQQQQVAQPPQQQLLQALQVAQP